MDLKRFEYYNSLTLTFDAETNRGYPVGKLGDVTIEFIHYKSNEEAFAKWEERKQRINLDNLFVIFTDRDGCTEENLREIQAFDKKTDKHFGLYSVNHRLLLYYGEEFSFHIDSEYEKGTCITTDGIKESQPTFHQSLPQ